VIAAQVYVDWDADGGLYNEDDISEFVKGVTWQSGIWNQDERVARAGQATVTLNNLDRRFSPDNMDSPYYGRMRPNLPVRVDALFDNDNFWVVFRGVITDIVVESGDLGRREARIVAEDLMGVLSRTKIALPVRKNIAPPEALKLVTSAVFRSPQATGTVTFTANPSAGNAVTVGERVYTFGALSGPNQVLVGATPTATAMNLAAAINAAQTGIEYGYGAEQVYGTDTLKHPDVTAKFEGTADGSTTHIEPTVNVADDYIGKRNRVGPKELAQSFRVTAGTLVQIKVYVGDSVGGSPGTVTWEVRDSVGGVPGSVLQSGTFTPTPDQWNTINVSDGVALYDGVAYWLVLRLTTVPASNLYYEWRFGKDNYADGISALRVAPAAWIPTPGFDQFLEITTGGVANAVVNLLAVARGAWGNDIALSADGASISVEGMAGGADGPADLIDFEPSGNTLVEVGSTWDAEKTSALRAVQEIVESEGTAVFFAHPDSGFTYRNRDWLFRAAKAGPHLTVDGEAQRAQVKLSLDGVVNRVTLRYRPLDTRTFGVIARSTGTITVPGVGQPPFTGGSQERHNASQDLPNPDNTAFVQLSYVDVPSGRVIGASELALPLVAGVDYTVNDQPDGTGFDYTHKNRVLFSVAATGSGVEDTMQNSALGPLYVRGLQQRGVGIISFDPLDVKVEDTNSIALYGLVEETIYLPFMLANTHNFAPVLARYILNRKATPRTEQEPLAFINVSEVDGMNLFALGPGTIVTMSEPQMLVTGVSGSIQQGNLSSLQWHTWRLDDFLVGQWDEDKWDEVMWSL
jgi:hypothetical protein